MKKRILSVLLALCMCLTFVPVSVFAEDLQQDNSISVLSITPDEGTYCTYVFTVDSKEIDRQIVKNGDTLLEPQVPAQDGKVFTGWSPEVTFGPVSNVDKTETITVEAQFEAGYHVYFKDNNGRIIATETVASGTKVTFEDVKFPVGSDEAITGWYKDADRTEKVDSVTINGADITLYAKVEKGHWITFESNGGSYVEPKFFVTSANTKEPTDPTKPGYAFAGWYNGKDQYTFGNTLTENIELKAHWTAQDGVKYTVIHWLENADDDGYSYKESETKTGTTGGQTNATAKSYTGFTAQTITQETIKGDGSTIVSVYYKRNEYSVKFFTDRKGKNEDTSKRITAKYGANIRKQWPGGSWYVSTSGNKAQSNIDTMPLNGKNFYGQQSGYQTYNAYYYTEVLPGQTGDTTVGSRTYKLDHTDTIQAGWGLKVTDEERYPITGFTCNTAVSTKNGQSYNGSKFYYTRNSYDIVFISGGKTVKTAPVKYQASIADYANYKPDNAPEGMEDYVFAGWYASQECTGDAYVFTGKTMPAQNITLYAKWVAPTYTVTVYDVDGSVHYTFNKVAKNSTISSDVIPDLKLAEGETFLGWVQKDGTPFSFSTKINQNYDLYAKVGNNSRYKVTYHSNTTPDATVTDDTMIYAKDVLATVNDNSFTNGDMVFLGWNTKDDGTGTTYYPNGTIKVTGNMDLYAQWGRRSSTVTVTYHSNFGTDRTYVTDAEVNNARITVADYTTLGLPARTGYTFAGWNTEADGTGRTFAAGAFARVDVTEPNDLYAQWTPNTDTTYKVEFYYQNDDGSYPSTASKTEPRTGTTDTTVSVTNADKEAKENGKYTFDANNANNILSGPVAADGSLVLKLYFKLNQADVTVNYYWNETTDKVATSKTLSAQTVGTSVTESPIAIEGYTAVSNASQTITIDVSDNVINFYYYKNVELTANSKTETYDGTEKSVSGYTGAPEGVTFNGISASGSGTDVGEYNVIFDGTPVGKVDTTNKYIVTETTPGKLTIKPVEVTVTIKGNTKTETYDGTEYTVTGYTIESISNDLYSADNVTLKDGAKAEAKGTNAGDYMMGLTAGSFANSNTNFEVTFVVEDGKLTIKPAEVTVTIKGNTKTETYDGTEYTVTGYTVESISNNLYKEEYFALKTDAKVEAKGTNAGDYMMGLTKESFENKNTNFKVTFVVEDGKLTIAKRDVTVTGESATKVYNGQTQEINGYTVDNLVKGHEMTGVIYSAKGKDPGKYDGSFTGSQIVIKDAAGNDVTKNYNFKTVIGALTITQPSHPTRPSTPTKDVTSVKTADGSQMTLWMSMMLASAAGIVFLGKKRKEEQ